MWCNMRKPRAGSKTKEVRSITWNDTLINWDRYHPEIEIFSNESAIQYLRINEGKGVNGHTVRSYTVKGGVPDIIVDK